MNDDGADDDGDKDNTSIFSNENVTNNKCVDGAMLTDHMAKLKI